LQQKFFLWLNVSLICLQESGSQEHNFFIRFNVWWRLAVQITMFVYITKEIKVTPPSLEHIRLFTF